jgi:hypothetical protein
MNTNRMNNNLLWFGNNEISSLSIVNPFLEVQLENNSDVGRLLFGSNLSIINYITK